MKESFVSLSGFVCDISPLARDSPSVFTVALHSLSFLSLSLLCSAHLFVYVSMRFRLACSRSSKTYFLVGFFTSFSLGSLFPECVQFLIQLATILPNISPFLIENYGPSRPQYVRASFLIVFINVQTGKETQKSTVSWQLS